MHVLAQIDIFEILAQALGRFTGNALGLIVAALFYLLIVYVIWALPWSRIISKAGFRGRVYWVLFFMIFVPAALGFPASEKFGPSSEVAQALGVLMAICTYIVLLTLAFAPWSIRRELSQMRKTQSQGGD